MANYRDRLYYSDAQTIKNVYTSGSQWMTIDDWKEYVGYYHIYSSGEVYTEKEWNKNRSKKLVEYKKRDASYYKYMDLNHYMTTTDGKKSEIVGGTGLFHRYTAPRAVKVRPSKIDYSKGLMTRYFVYKRNEPDRIFFEVGKDQATDYTANEQGINQYLYGLVKIPWKITGPEYDIFNNGILIESGVVDTNKRIIDRFSEKFRILPKVLINHREHSKYEL
jgi:hypothetical protein